VPAGLNAGDELAAGENEQIAIKRSLNLRERDIVHVGIVFGRVELVDEDAVGQLHGDLVAVHGDFLDVVPALDPHLLLGHQVLRAGGSFMRRETAAVSCAVEQRRWLLGANGAR
jgi:hypothetical protein